MDDNIKKRNTELIKETIKNLQKRNFEAFYCETKTDALNEVVKMITKEQTVSWGGSITLDEIGIKEYLENNSYKTINRDSAKTKEEKEKAVIESLGCDVFLMSANALCSDGHIVNIDGKGNRLAALCFGPKKVIMVIGVNKIVKTLDDAITRARNVAAPINAQRISKLQDMKTPCLNTGSCCHCKLESSICSQILVTRLSRPKYRICTIIVNEDLGY